MALSYASWLISVLSQPTLLKIKKYLFLFDFLNVPKFSHVIDDEFRHVQIGRNINHELIPCQLIWQGDELAHKSWFRNIYCSSRPSCRRILHIKTPKIIQRTLEWIRLEQVVVGFFQTSSAQGLSHTTHKSIKRSKLRSEQIAKAIDNLPQKPLLDIWINVSILFNKT